MADLSPGIGFVAVTPCRIVDTRGGGVFTGTYGPPALVGNAVARPFDINSAPHCAGIPAGAEAYSLNFTVIAAAGAFQNAFLTAWPTGGAQPVVSTLNFNAGQLVANAAIVPAGTNGSINVFVNAPGHLLIDINGYFTDDYNSQIPFVVNSTVNANGAIQATNSSSVDLSKALFAHATAASGRTFGVWGETSSGSLLGAGVVGVASAASGLSVGTWGQTASSTDGAIGVFGDTIHEFSVSYGVSGHTRGQSGSAGVVGTEGSGAPGGIDYFARSGVRGESVFHVGVLGLTEDESTGSFSLSRGVQGIVVTPTGNSFVASGNLGYNQFNTGGINYGVYSEGPYGGSGAKYFVEPHPEKADTVIRYVSLEGNESGTYFRGRSRFQNGVATIDVPEDFRLVTDSEGITVQVTPIGQMASVGVVRIGLDRIVVRGSRNVEFSYMVNGVRKTHKHLTPIGPGREYMPETSEAKMPLWVTEGQKQMLISNGTYNADGTVNMETAKRLGWDKEWEKRERPRPQPIE